MDSACVYRMGNKLAPTSQVAASEYHLHDVRSPYNKVVKEALGCDRGRFYRAAGTLRVRNKISDSSWGVEESHDVKKVGMVSLKTESIIAAKRSRNEGQEDAIREAMATFLDMDKKVTSKANEPPVNKVKFRDRFLRGEKGEEMLEEKMNVGLILQEEDSVVKETSCDNSLETVAIRNASQFLSGRSKVGRERDETSAQNIIRRAETLSADSSLHGDASTAIILREKKWLKLLTSVQQEISTKSERVQLILQILDMMYESGTTPNAMHISAAVTACVNEKALDVAERIVERARATNETSVNVFAYSKLLQGYCSSNQRKEAYALLAEMDAEGVEHDVAIYNILIETEQSPEGVEVLWRELELRGLQPNARTYCGAIRCYGRAGQLGAVRDLWQEMAAKDVPCTFFTFNSLLDAYANIGDVETCNTIVTEMETRKLKLSTESYNTLLKAHARCRDANGAIVVLRTMQRRGVKPCIISYNTAMDACIRGRGMLRAIGLAKELPRHRLKPDATTFATLLRAAGLLRDKTIVHKVLQDMKSSGCSHDEITHRCAVYAYVHCGEGGLALEMLEKMNAAGFPPAMTVPEVLVKSVDAALLRECIAAAPAGKLDQFLADMAAAGLSPTREAAGAMVRKLAHTPGIHVALDVAAELRRGGIRGLGLHTWQSVISASVARAEQNPFQASAEIIRILDNMESDGTAADRMVYESALSVFVKCGDGGRAMSIYEKMRLANLSPATEEDGKDPLQRMLLDTVDAALVGALIAGLEGTGVDGGVPGDKNGAISASIVEDLADAGIRMKPGAMTNVIRQLCADVQTPSQIPEDTGVLAVRKPSAGTPQPQAKLSEKDLEDFAQERKIQRLERAMQSVEASNCLFGMQATSFVYGSLMEACVRLQKLRRNSHTSASQSLPFQGERVETLWQRMRTAAVAPDERMWVSRVQALASVGHFEGRTQELLDEVAQDRLELDSAVLRAILKACHQVKDMAGVVQIRRMLSTSGRFSPSNASAHAANTRDHINQLTSLRISSTQAMPVGGKHF